MADIIDPHSPVARQIIRNSAFEKPLTQGDAPSLEQRIADVLSRMPHEAFAECTFAEEVEDVLRATLANSGSRPETPTPDEMWARATKFVRDILEAVGERGHDTSDTQYPAGAWVDLETLTLQVVGQIEELKVENERLKSILSTPSSLVPRLREMTFERFSAVNRQRCESESGFNHKLDSWSTSDWFLALFGELGEAANIAKKLNRVRDGIPGNKETPAALRDKLRRELGDAFVYLDLLAQSLDVSIGEVAVEVFNAKSEEIGCPIRMALREAADALEGQKEP